jgi:hypothetical protein
MLETTRADVIIGSESWLNPEIASSEVFPPGFNVYRRDRPRGTGGGVFILVSDNLDSREPEEMKVTTDTDCELVWAATR